MRVYSCHDLQKIVLHEGVNVSKGRNCRGQSKAPCRAAGPQELCLSIWVLKNLLGGERVSNGLACKWRRCSSQERRIVDTIQGRYGEDTALKCGYQYASTRIYVCRLVWAWVGPLLLRLSGHSRVKCPLHRLGVTSLSPSSLGECRGCRQMRTNLQIRIKGCGHTFKVLCPRID